MQIINHIIEKIGRTVSWLWLVTTLIIFLSVVLRYAFGSGLVALEELSWHIAGAAWLIALSYAFIKNAHVRITLLHDYFPKKTQYLVDLVGHSVLLMPFFMLVFIYSVPYVMESYHVAERSSSPSGLEYRWALKAFIPFAFLLLILATLSRIVKVYQLFITANNQTEQ